ncbi:hypothetical protein [Clostridium sp.]|uniref:hypothetical protein n=1 Tax=Clostridium sp. TaxID=1506 RepID=UPI002850B268|nr:hypothetical protein [Clostridium sp.]MDR3596722.1 hypothetical protein [Clostridium sp.]
MRIKNWIVTIENVDYRIEFISKFYKKELLVNKVPVKLEFSKTFGITRETIFKLGTTTAILVNIDRNSDIVIDGTYLDSGEKHITVKNIPLWTYLFLGLILLIYLFSYTSICSALFSLLGCYFLIRISIEPSFNLKQRILFCLIITLLLHLFFWYVLFLLI